jgi:hypothetical protein
MKNYLFFCLFVLFTASSCSVDADSSSVIRRDEMADVLNDIALAEGYVESYIFKDSSINKDSAVQAEIDKALQLRKITPDLFSRSYRYYRLHPDEFKIIADTANVRAIKARDNSYSRRVLKSS